ncbi:discoidin domain-containing protein [Flavicella sp.]|uniref:discoidin domain-containing protein n=1 Tax=Flavicella sp. TaxID=2957742 RepID=UPI003019E2FC
MYLATVLIVDFSTEEAGGEDPVNGYGTAGIDGDPGTFWHSNWSSTGSSYPHHLTIDLGSEKSIASFEIFRRVTGVNKSKIVKIKIFKVRKS